METLTSYALAIASIVFGVVLLTIAFRLLRTPRNSRKST
jgi:hypothetical protein